MEEDRAALDELCAYANSLPPLVPQQGKFMGRSVPINLTKVRILDILLWTEVAVHGATPHQAWSLWYQAEGFS